MNRLMRTGFAALLGFAIAAPVMVTGCSSDAEERDEAVREWEAEDQEVRGESLEKQGERMQEQGEGLEEGAEELDD